MLIGRELVDRVSTARARSRRCRSSPAYRRVAAR